MGDTSKRAHCLLLFPPSLEVLDKRCPTASDDDPRHLLIAIVCFLVLDESPDESKVAWTELLSFLTTLAYDLFSIIVDGRG